MKVLALEDTEMDVCELARRVKRAKETIVLTRRGKPVLLVHAATGEDRETIALSANASFARFINKRRASAKKHGTIPFDELCKKYDLPPLSNKKK